MNGEQLFFYLILGFIAFLYVKKKWSARGLKNYSSAEVKERIKSGSILLDVRTARERSSRSISGSIHIPLHELGSKLNDLERHRSKEIICYCASGSRSVSAAAVLKKAGFDAANLNGGITAWDF